MNRGRPSSTKPARKAAEEPAPGPVRQPRSFAPVIGPGVRILVLGSLPGARSLEAGAYYAHPQNRFWPVVEQVFGIPAAASAATRYPALVAAGVALWDGLEAAAREGSLDAAIEASSEVPNPVGLLLQAHPGIETVALNGRKAEAIWVRWLAPTLSAGTRARLRIHLLPSTSPANARYRLDDLVEAWGPVLRGESEIFGGRRDV